ncbi:succinate dehydrogenase, hydrophobic membrane anchor protein [Actibacterium sp. D379-3]
MAFLTDRKRAVGMGAAKQGPHHMWTMQITAMAMAVLVPLFVFTFGPMLGKSHDEVVAYFGQPFPAIVAILTMVVGFYHFRNGIQVVIEDYVGGAARKTLIMVMTCVSYALMAIGVFAIAKIAL